VDLSLFWFVMVAVGTLQDKYNNDEILFYNSSNLVLNLALLLNKKGIDNLIFYFYKNHINTQLNLPNPGFVLFGLT
jgi:hypothetical protein